jgi:hypothetical protein
MGARVNRLALRVLGLRLLSCYLMGAYCVRLLMVQLVLRVNPVPAIPVRLGKIFWAVMLV